MKTIGSLSIWMMTMLLTSCGGKGTSSIKLEISPAFVVTNTKFGGGLIIYAESGTKRISIPLDSSRTHTLDLPKGTWTFTAIGWDGGSAPEAKFTSTMHCGTVSENLDQPEETISLPITPAGCTTTFKSTYGIRSLWVSICGAFYSYSSSTDQFTAAPNADNFCSTLPAEYQASPKYVSYRIVAQKLVAGSFEDGFKSACKSLSGRPGNELEVPTVNIPLKVKLYKTSTDCVSDINAEEFTHGKGLSGVHSDFDSLLSIQSATAARLALPNFESRRAKSPFMNMIPRIQCGPTDCLDGVNITNHVNVRWDDKVSHPQLLLKNAAASDCTNVSLASNDFFELVPGSCELRGGDIYGKIQRRELYCQDISEIINPQDIYTRDGLLYILHQKPLPSTANDRSVTIFDQATGRRIYSTFLGINFQRIAVDTNRNLYAINPVASTNSVTRFAWDASAGAYLAPVSINLANVTAIDVSTTGSVLYVGFPLSTDVKAYTYSNPAIPSLLGTGQARLSASADLTDLRLVGTDLYILEKNGSNTIFSKFPLNAQALDPRVELTNFSDPGRVFRHFSFADDENRFYFQRNDGLFEATSDFTNYSSVASNSVAASKAFSVKSSTIFLVGTGLVVAEIDSGLINGLTDSDGSCSSTLLFSDGAAVPETINLDIIAKKDNVYDIFADVLDIAGLRDFVPTGDKPAYFFESLARKEQDGLAGGGRLEVIQEILGPDGIGGAFSHLQTCPGLKAALIQNGPVSLTMQKPDGTQSMNVQVSLLPASPSHVIGAAFCNDSSASDSGCQNDPFDLQFQISQSGINNRKMHLKLKCGPTSKKIGSLEILEETNSPAGSGDRRIQLKWNTQNENMARLETHVREVDPARTILNVLALRKTTSDVLQLRSITFVDDGTTRTGSALEAQRNSSNWIRNKYQISAGSGIFFSQTGSVPEYPGLTFQGIRDSSNFNGSSPLLCMAKINTEPYTNSSAGCPNFSTGPNVTSKGFSLSLFNFNADDLSSGYFTLAW